MKILHRAGPMQAHTMIEHSEIMPGLARQTAHKDWRKLFEATIESCQATREFCVQRFQASGKACSVAESIQHCKRI